MKKGILILVLATFIAVGVASISEAGTTGNYNWQTRTTTATTTGVPAEACEYYQWNRKRCTPEAAPTPAPTPERVVLEGIYFDTGSAKIKTESYTVLDKNAASLKTKTTKSIVIIGHTDSVGSDSYNNKLSEARAKSVMDYFATRGIDSSRMNASGRGETEPRSTNDTETGRAQNRRIEIEFAR